MGLGKKSLGEHKSERIQQRQHLEETRHTRIPRRQLHQAERASSSLLRGRCSASAA